MIARVAKPIDGGHCPFHSWLIYWGVTPVAFAMPTCVNPSFLQCCLKLSCSFVGFSAGTVFTSFRVVVFVYAITLHSCKSLVKRKQKIVLQFCKMRGIMYL